MASMAGGFTGIEQSHSPMAHLLAGTVDLPDPVETAMDRVVDAQTSDRLQTDAPLSEQFVQSHTEFDSFAAFADRSPWALAGSVDPADVPRDRLDEYVAAHTEFDSWEAMRTRAAAERIVDQLQT